MIHALLLLLLAAPEPTDTPRAAVERLVASVRRVDLTGAYEQLGEGGRALVDKNLTRTARTFGLDETATPVEVVAEMEKRFATDLGKQIAAEFDIRIEEPSIVKETARAKARVFYGGKQEEVVLLFARKQGRWRIDGVDASKARSRANEMGAIATLRNITSAQAQFQACAKADANRNGTGEYGTFGELSGAVEVRGGAKLNPPVLSSAFRKVEGGVVTRNGYHYRIFLCDAQGHAIGEEKGTKGVDAAKSETTWCAYAWPVEYGKTGKRSFFVNQFGDVLQLDHKGYSGKSGPKADAAFRTEAIKGRITGQTAIAAIGNDGHEWKPLR